MSTLIDAVATPGSGEITEMTYREAVNAAIRKIGGVYGRQSLDGSPDFGLLGHFSIGGSFAPAPSATPPA